MGNLIRINGVLLDPDAIESVAPYLDEKSHNQCVRVHMRGGQEHTFGMTVERFNQIVRESVKSV